MPIDRRDFIRQTAAATAGAIAGIPLAKACSLMDGLRLLDFTPASSGRRHRCRFCGTGCGVSVAVQDNRVVATHGDPRGRGQPRPQLREGLLPLQDHVRRRSPD